MIRPLNGVRVVDLTSVLMGPFATQLLADMGAEVLKVEPPAGDTVRGIGPTRNPGMGAIFLHANRGKKSVVLDLKVPAGREALLRIARTADVLIYNLRPQAMARLALSYEDVALVNPGIVYVGVFGFGEGGPYSARPAYDDLIQGAVGLPALVAACGDDVPRYVPTTFADRTVGLYALSTVLGALFHRQRTGEGQRIDVPMFETMAQFVLGDHLQGATFDPPRGPTGYSRFTTKERVPYRTLDGHLCVVIYSDRHWRSFFAAIGRPEVMERDERFRDIGARTRHIGELYRMVGEVMATRTTAQWMELLERADIPAFPLATIDTLVEDPHLEATGFFRWIDHPSEGRVRSMAAPSRWSRTQPAPGGPAPRLGEHTEEALRSAGYDTGEIDALVAAGAARRDVPPAR